LTSSFACYSERRVVEYHSGALTSSLAELATAAASGADEQVQGAVRCVTTATHDELRVTTLVVEILQRRTSSYYSVRRRACYKCSSQRRVTTVVVGLLQWSTRYYSGRRVTTELVELLQRLLSYYTGRRVDVELLRGADELLQQHRRATTASSNYYCYNYRRRYCTNSVAHVRLVEHYYSSGALVTNIQQTSIWYWCRRVTTVVVASLQWRRCWCIISLFAWFHCEFRFWQVSITNIIIFKLVCAYP